MEYQVNPSRSKVETPAIFYYRIYCPPPARRKLDDNADHQRQQHSQQEWFPIAQLLIVSPGIRNGASRASTPRFRRPTAA